MNEDLRQVRLDNAAYNVEKSAQRLREVRMEIAQSSALIRSGEASQSLRTQLVIAYRTAVDLSTMLDAIEKETKKEFRTAG